MSTGTKKHQRQVRILTKIGEILAYSPKMPDGDKKPIIPTVEVAEILQELNDDTIDEAFYFELFNQRGGTWRGSYDGGEQERELASRYEEGANNMEQYPRMQKILGYLKNNYRNDAERCDAYAQNKIDKSYKI